MDGVLNEILPLLNKRNASSPLEWRGESAGGDGNTMRLLKEIPGYQERYKDFPELVGALDVIATMAEHTGDRNEYYIHVPDRDVAPNIA